MKEEYRVRSYDLIPENVLSTPIHIVGAGAVGSFTALALAKMGFDNLSIYDPDSVAEENVGCQLYGPPDVEVSKVVALEELIGTLAGGSVATYMSVVEDISNLSGIVIMAVDNMATRKKLFESLHGESAVDLLIDPRMGAEVATLYTVRDQASAESYKKTLFSDEEGVQEPCTAKATTYCALLLSGMVARVVKGFLCKEKHPHTVQWSIRDDDFNAWRL